MKRLITYIKDLFGADEQLRKWCIERVGSGGSRSYIVETAETYYRWVKGDCASTILDATESYDSKTRSSV